MTCQHCQTQQYEAVILDDDYRCRRCGRRVRSTPARPSPSRFPVESSAAARAYEIDFETDFHAEPLPSLVSPEQTDGEQKRLFETAGTEPRIIAFESLTTAAERQSIHARAAGLSRPAPLRTEKVQVKHARAAKTRPIPGSGVRNGIGDQRRLEFEGQEGILTQPTPSIICDAPVAPVRLRLEASLIDCLVIAIPCCFAIALFKYVGGPLTAFDRVDKYFLPLVVLSLATIPIFYKLLWAFAGCDTIGMQRAGLQLVDFDGNPPSKSRRYQRFCGSLLSLFAAGIGLIWSLVDEDRLTWHDHISNTFPTLISEE